MKLYFDKLGAQLKKGLAPVYVVSGNEPLLCGEAADSIRAAARAQGFDERESHLVSNANQFKWQECFASLDNLSLFASRKIFELRLPNGKPGREGGAILAQLAQDAPADVLFLILLPKLDKATRSSKWATALTQGAVWVDIAEPNAESLPQWLAARASAAGLQFDAEALTLLAARTEGNLLQAQQEIDRLALLLPGQRISADEIAGSVADGARFDVYQLADAALRQDVQRALRVLYGLRREGIADALICWALVREVTVLVDLWAALQAGQPMAQVLKRSRIWANRQPLYRKALQAHSAASVRALLELASVADRVVKGARYGSPQQVLVALVTLLACPRQAQQAATALLGAAA